MLVRKFPSPNPRQTDTPAIPYSSVFSLCNSFDLSKLKRKPNCNFIFPNFHFSPLFSPLTMSPILPSFFYDSPSPCLPSPCLPSPNLPFSPHLFSPLPISPYSLHAANLLPNSFQSLPWRDDAGVIVCSISASCEVYSTKAAISARFSHS